MLGLLKHEVVAFLYRSIKSEADELAGRLGVPLQIDRIVIGQAYDEAEHSLTFHRRQPSNIIDLHRRELSHLLYWIADLKPVTFLEPMSLHNYISNLVAKSDFFAVGPRAVDARLEPLYRQAEDRYASVFEGGQLAINEHVAFRCLSNIFESYSVSVIHAETRPHFQSELTRQLEDFKEVLAKKISAPVIYALRYHIFTPRSFATLVESTFAFDGHG